MLSPEKRSCSAPPDNRSVNLDERCDNGVTHRSNSFDRKAKHGKLFTVEIQFLDESKTIFQLNHKSLCKVLFNQVCQTLNLIEIDYFGIQYFDPNGTMYWLDLEKPIYRQLSLNLSTNITMYFAVKFYCSDPSRLEDELTRYLFSLQIKKDLSRGELHCNENTAALMASFIIQAECGDFNLEEYVDHSYVSRFKLIPHQDEEFEWRVMENHKKHIGQSPSEADYNLLETARRCEMYGIKLTAVKDHEGVPLNLSVAHLGVVVFQNQTKVNTFSWAKIRKLSFKRKRFLIKLHQEEYFGDVVEFFFDGRNECKNFWKKCIEQHSFFRCVEVKHNPKQKTKIFSRGSSFRYSGRTQQQVVDYVRQSCIKREPFQRSNSLRHNSITERSQNIDGSSISIQPLFPVSRNNKDQSSEEMFEEERPKSAQETATVMHKESICETPPSPSVKERPSDLSNLTLNLNEASINNLWTIDNLSSNIINASQTKSKSSLVNALNRKMTFNSETDQRRSRHRLEKEYHVFRELVMSERTYKKDIELINTWFKDDVSKETSRPTEMLSLLFSATEPLLEIHNEFLEQIELLLLIWEGKSLAEYNRSIGDVLSDIISWLPLYERLIERLPFILERINASFRHNRDFERACRDFESRKGCYLPYTSFILKPAFHITHYCHIFEKLLHHYASNNPEYGKCKYVVEQLKQFNGEYAQTLNSLINLVILIELQRDITGMDNIVQSGRTFVREGCLLKLSKKGYQQRLFFLFSDIIIYASRSSSAQFQFKVHGHLPLQNIMVEETEPKLGINFCFTIYGGDRALMVAANSDDERHIWMQDLSDATFKLSHINGELLPFFPTVMSSNELLDKIDNALSQRWIQKSDTHVSQMENFDKLQSRSNTMAHVCWHRNCSISADDYKHALTSCLSGYLLRKFKNSSGWQKLWVVFTHFCLFFYKSHQDDFPLASLPLLGYTLSMPSDIDNINKNYVFKLQFKTHVYFFRTESEYTFTQWMDVIKNSTMKSNSFNDNI